MVKSLGRANRLLKWLVIVAMIAIAKPVWQYAEQRLIRHVLEPGVTVSACQVLNRSNVASLSDLSWQYTTRENSKIAFDAEQVWARYDMAQLLRKRFHFSEIKAENVAIRLTEQSQDPTDSAPLVAEQWRRELASKLASVVPEELVSNSKLVQGARQSLAAWERQFNTWLEHGKAIVHRSQLEESHLQQLDTNPLRSQPEIVTVLSNLQVLKQQFEKTDSEIKESEKAFDEQRRSLANLKQADLAEIEKLFAGMPESIAQPTGKAIVMEWFHDCWNQYSGLCESVDLVLGKSKFLNILPNAGTDYRPSCAEVPLVVVRNAMARGSFEFANSKIPFVARGKHVQTSNQRLMVNSSWRVEGTFPKSNIVIAVRDQSADPKSQRDLALASYPRTGKLERTQDARPESLCPIFEIKCSVVGDQLNGSAMLDVSQWLKDQSEEANPRSIVDVRDLPESDAGAGSASHCLYVRIGGTWRSPSITLVEDAPGWIASRLDQEYQAALGQARQRTVSLLDQEQSEALQALTKVVNSRRAQAIVQYRQMRAQLVLAEKVQRDMAQRASQGFVRRIQVAPTVNR